jgi:nuclear GTP-binding protein
MPMDEESGDVDDDSKPQQTIGQIHTDESQWSNEVEETEKTGLNNKGAGQNSRRAYLSELRKVVDGADVILHVLDARDPIGTRSVAIEEMVLSTSEKKLVFVLNKSDLVPREVLSGWLAYLRKSCPAVPFKCNTQSQKENLGRATGKVVNQQEGALKTNQAVGAEELLGLLKNYSRVGDSKSVITVGIVGFPNVGKSSLINSLMRSRAAAVSSVPGFTKVNQEVILDKNIRLIDSPGIVFADGDSAATALRNCVNVEEMVDVLTPVQAVLERCPQAYLMQLYAIPKFKSTDCVGFLALVARNTGKLKKGGIPNTDAAARIILHDWNTGKIKYYCKPPVQVSGGGVGEGDSMVLSGFSKELDVDRLRDEDMKVLDALEAMASNEPSTGYVAMDTLGDKMDLRIDADYTGKAGLTVNALAMHTKSVEPVTQDDEDDDEMEQEKDDSRSFVSKASSIKRAKAAAKKSARKTAEEEEAEEMPTENARKVQKKMIKKGSKDVRRNKPTETADYNFEEDYKY